MIIQELLSNLYSDISPYSSCDIKYADSGYPHTNISVELLNKLFENIKPTYVLECGSMLGGSAIRMAKLLDENHQIVCIDPFTGDVNMWDWEGKASWKFLRLEKGISTIYKRFLANCKLAGFEKKILPINCTTTVGVRLLGRLYEQKRISSFPNYIYLDSAHEPDETFLELGLCWNLLDKNGVLFGDDWDWPAVMNDVIKFSNTINEQVNYQKLLLFNKLIKNSKIYKNILLYKNHWILFKKNYKIFN